MPCWPALAHLHHSLAIALMLAMSPAMAERAYVTCQPGDALDVLDLGSGTTVASWVVPGKPAGVAVAENGEVFTVSADGKTIRRWSADKGSVLAEVTLDGGPIGIALDQGRNRLFVSDWYNARIWVLHDRSLKPLAELTTGKAPAGLALSDDRLFLASADKDADQVSVFDAQTLALLHRVNVGANPFGLRFAPDGLLFVGNVGTNDLSVIDAATGNVSATIPVGERPYGVAFAQDRAFVTNQYENTVTVIDLETLKPVSTIEVGEYPEGIDTLPNGKAVVLVNWFDNTATIIDAERLVVVDTIDTCDGPRAFGTFILGGGKPWSAPH